jgi:hypothetical protein
MTNTQDDELTLEQRKEVDAYLEGYKNNPSNSNKWRIGLHAYINELIQDRERQARIDELDRLIDINSKTFNQWGQKDIAHFFDTVGKRYRELEATLTNQKPNKEDE